jgi:hypothetical protein
LYPDVECDDGYLAYASGVVFHNTSEEHHDIPRGFVAFPSDDLRTVADRKANPRGIAEAQSEAGKN